ncbi:MAG: cellulase family glycosylhydrolase [Xanthomonadales bacterium]|nr:cellulase family glycosylhydrolase [Xanthomonadales bacterium]NIX13575.1 cellulase family glycosylhydrolase [Xanthomonadales bacterium]
MQRRRFLKSSLALGGLAAAPAGVSIATANGNKPEHACAFKDPFAGLQELGRVRPRASDQVGESYWGIQAGAFDDDTLAKARAIGVKWTRITIGWDGVEQEKGQFHWTRFDETLDALLRFGITPFVTLTRGNRLYTGMGTYDDPRLAAIYGNSPYPPTDAAGHAAWLKFVSRAIKRYRDRISYWEVWNEPNHRNYWGAPENGKDYGDLVRITVEKIRELQPDAKIIAGSMAGIDPEFTDLFLDRCDPEQIDIISFHNYGTRPENRVYRIPEFKAVLDKYKPGFEIWQGECGAPSQSRTTGYRGMGPWGLNIQSKWLLRQSFVDTWFCHCTMSNYFKLFDEGDVDPEPTERTWTDLDRKFGAPERNGSRMHANGINQKCLLVAHEGTPKPAYYAYQALCAAMDSRYRRIDPEYRFRVQAAGSFHGIGDHEDAFPSVPLLASYHSDESAFLAWWLPWFPQEHVAEFADVTLDVGVGFKAPVLLDLLNGNAYKVTDFEASAGKTRFRSLSLADYPLALAERGELDLVT